MSLISFAGSWGDVDIVDISPAAGSARVPPPGEFGEDGEVSPLTGGLGLAQPGPKRPQGVGAASRLGCVSRPDVLS